MLSKVTHAAEASLTLGFTETLMAGSYVLWEDARDPPLSESNARRLEMDPPPRSMLFYASEKYPKEDEYSKFISDNGGITNAWTASENTNYQASKGRESCPVVFLPQ